MSRTLASSWGSVEKLERLGPPRLQPPLPPHVRHGNVRDPQLMGQQAARPVGHAQMLRWFLQGGQHDRHLVQLLRTTRPGPVVQGPDPAPA